MTRILEYKGYKYLYRETSLKPEIEVVNKYSHVGDYHLVYMEENAYVLCGIHRYRFEYDLEVIEESNGCIILKDTNGISCIYKVDFSYSIAIDITSYFKEGLEEDGGSYLLFRKYSVINTRINKTLTFDKLVIYDEDTDYIEVIKDGETKAYNTCFYEKDTRKEQEFKTMFLTLLAKDSNFRSEVQELLKEEDYRGWESWTV